MPPLAQTQTQTQTMPVRNWTTPDVPVYKYAGEDRDWDEYPGPRQPAKSNRASTAKAASNKRTADVGAVEPPKKRRKDEQPSAPAPSPAVVGATKRAAADAHRMAEERVAPPTDLSSLPVSSLVSYLVKHDIIPPIHPSPYTLQPTLAPTILLNPPSHTPPPPTLPQTEPERRRSSRFQEDDLADLDPSTHHVPILTDLDGVHGALAKLVERHWSTKTVREQETIAGFVWSAQRARERTLLAASSAGHS